MDAHQRRVGERRLRHRRGAEGCAIAARVRPGHHADVVDVSSDGAQVDTGCRLRPGTFVDLQIEMEAYRAQVRARVVHARVLELSADNVRYRGGLVFERELERLADPNGEESPE